MRARTAEEFAQSLATFSVPAQNMLHAGRDGRIGYVTGAALPARATPARDVVCDPAEAAAWDTTITSPRLPRHLDPASGFIASANDRPPPRPVRVGSFFSPPVRVERMRKLLAGDGPVTPADLAALQADVGCDASLAIRDALLSRMTSRECAHPVAKLLAGWDGNYAAGSAGALAYEVLVADLARRLIPPARFAALSAVWTGRETIAEELRAAPTARLRQAMPRALRRAAGKIARFRTWGGAHRLVLRHPFAILPGIGRRYRFGDFPADGANDTLNKSGHKPVRGRHRVSFGASARFIADMAEPNANRVVLLGGQDGWIGSGNFLDQIPIWRNGGYIELPLEAERARAWPHHTVHAPSPRSGSDGDA
jgi:penicillin amidase